MVEFGVMLYFAYGSNINLKHLMAYLGTHDVDPAEISAAEHGRLLDYRLRTNYFAASHTAGACNIEADPESCVEGVLMTISGAARDALRLYEGFPHRYEEIEVIVHTASAQGSVRALTYVVTSEHRLDTDLPVTARYRDLILSGAKQFKFTEAYQNSLRDQLKIAPILKSHGVLKVS